MLKLLIFFSLCLQIFFSYLYYRGQNNKKQIGGPIARPKIFWLGFTTYNYFALSLLLWWGLDLSEKWEMLLLIFIALIYFRAVIQSIFMFVSHIWIPPMGIGFNILFFCIIFTYGILHGDLLFNFSKQDPIAAIYIILILGSLITDSIYAYKFYKIVGRKTKGKEAIWYASEENPTFRKIVRLTRNLNMVYSIYYAFMLFKIFAL